MEIDEIRVLDILEAKERICLDLKASVIFGVGNEKFKTSVNEDNLGTIIWNEDQNIKIYGGGSSATRLSFSKLNNEISSHTAINKGRDKYKPLVFSITDRTSNLGKVIVPLSKLTTTQKKYSAPIVLTHDERGSTLSHESPILIYEAWITKYHFSNGQNNDSSHGSSSLENSNNHSKLESAINTKSLNRKSLKNLKGVKKNEEGSEEGKKNSASPLAFVKKLTGALEEEDGNQESAKDHNAESKISSSKSNFLTRHKRNYSSSNAATYGIITADNNHNDNNHSLPKRDSNGREESFKQDGSTPVSAHNSFSNVLKHIFKGVDKYSNNHDDKDDSSNFDYNSFQNQHHNTLPSKLGIGRNQIYNGSITSTNIGNTNEFDANAAPLISGISPMEAPIGHSTKVTIRGQHLGLDRTDLLSLYICGVNCTRDLQFHSPSKLTTLLYPESLSLGKKELVGDVLLVTHSSGTSRCLIKFRIYDPVALEEERLQTNSTHSDSYLNRSSSTTVTSSLRANGNKILNGHSPSALRNTASQFIFESSVNTCYENDKVTLHPQKYNLLNNLNGSVFKGSKTTNFNAVPAYKSALSNLYALENCTKEDLMQEVRNLRKHIQDMTIENNLMKTYVDTLVFRVMEICPEHLEKQARKTKNTL